MKQSKSKNMDKPKEIQHLISIGFKEIVGEWKPIWGQGDGHYYHAQLVRDSDIIYIDRDTTLFKYIINGVVISVDNLMEMK